MYQPAASREALHGVDGTLDAINTRSGALLMISIPTKQVVIGLLVVLAIAHVIGLGLVVSELRTANSQLAQLTQVIEEQRPGISLRARFNSEFLGKEKGFKKSFKPGHFQPRTE